MTDSRTMTQELAATESKGKAGWVGSFDSIRVAYWAGQNEPWWRDWFKSCRYGNVGLSADAFLPKCVWFKPFYWQPLPTMPPLDAPDRTE